MPQALDEAATKDGVAWNGNQDAWPDENEQGSPGRGRSPHTTHCAATTRLRVSPAPAPPSQTRSSHARAPSPKRTPKTAGRSPPCPAEAQTPTGPSGAGRGGELVQRQREPHAARQHAISRQRRGGEFANVPETDNNFSQRLCGPWPSWPMGIATSFQRSPASPHLRLGPSPPRRLSPREAERTEASPAAAGEEPGSDACQEAQRRQHHFCVDFRFTFTLFLG
ncbi:uncharacterized protein [Symphalangus syndactylus]|uniref:uncharacterized protein n=1 Tax=Symphalangus syndactylus TaxID=9590 RepID=UPI0030071DD1